MSYITNKMNNNHQDPCGCFRCKPLQNIYVGQRVEMKKCCTWNVVGTQGTVSEIEGSRIWVKWDKEGRRMHHNANQHFANLKVIDA